MQCLLSSCTSNGSKVWQPGLMEMRMLYAYVGTSAEGKLFDIKYISRGEISHLRMEHLQVFYSLIHTTQSRSEKDSRVPESQLS